MIDYKNNLKEFLKSWLPEGYEAIRVFEIKTKTGLRIHVVFTTPDGYKVDTALYSVIKLSGVRFWEFRRFTWRGERLVDKLAHEELLLDTLKKWSWIYKPSSRFVGGLVDGREQGVLLIYEPEQ